jgi:hypothetical protein
MAVFVGEGSQKVILEKIRKIKKGAVSGATLGVVRSYRVDCVG